MVGIVGLSAHDQAISLLTAKDKPIYDAASGGRGFRSQAKSMLSHQGTSMVALTEQQKEAYWRYNIQLTTVLLIIWFVTTYVVSGLLAGWLNQFTFLGFPLGYYMAAQGSLAIFVIEIAVYAYLMNRKDWELGMIGER